MACDLARSRPQSPNHCSAYVLLNMSQISDADFVIGSLSGPSRLSSTTAKVT
jgi:hypothetical protein